MIQLLQPILSVITTGSTCPSQRLQVSHSAMIRLNPSNPEPRLSISANEVDFLIRLISLEQDYLLQVNPQEPVLYRLGTSQCSAPTPLKPGHTMYIGDTRLLLINVFSPKVQNLQPVAPDSSSTPNVCRYCYDSSTASDPLLSVCRCSGSAQFVHLSCLRKWKVAQGAINQGQNVFKLTKAMISCEICKAGLFDSGLLTAYDLLGAWANKDISWGLFSSTHHNQGSTLLLIKLTQKGIAIGRNKDFSGVFNDGTVSRNHALLSYMDGEVLVKDMESMAGTYVDLQDEISLVRSPRIVLKVKTVTIEVKLQRQIR